MPDTFTLIWRLAVLATGNQADLNTWGAIQAQTMALMEQGAVGWAAVSIAGQTAYTLTTANNASDQARYLGVSYTGVLTGNCTVTMPNVARVGWAQNATTGGFNVMLTTGGGPQATIPPDGNWYWWQSDGLGDVSAPGIGFGSMGVAGNVTIGGTLSVAGASTFTGAVAVPVATLGTQASRLSQVPAANAATYTNQTLSRVLGTSYTNSTGRPLFVSVYGTISSPDQLEAQAPYLTPVAFSALGTVTSSLISVFFVVPPGATYAVLALNGETTVGAWLEL